MGLRFAIDTRALTWFRVALGALVVFDVLTWWPIAGALPTEAGVFSRDGRGFTPFVVFEVAHTEAAIKALLAVQALLGVGIAAGRGARALSLITFFWLGSLHEHALGAVDHGDVLLRTLTLWAAFVPLGSSGLPRRTIRSAGAVALTVQLPLVYLFTVLLKLRFAPVWAEGRAVEHALAIDAWVTSHGASLAAARGLLAPLTYVVIALELAIPILVVAAPRRRTTRILAFLLVVLLHLGLAMFLELALFPWVCLCAAIPFLFDGTPVDERAPEPRWADRLCLGLLTLALLSNVASLSEGWVARRFQSTLALLHIRQSWDMYVGDPSEVADGWFALRASKADGTVIDLLRDGAPPTHEKPAVVSRTYPSVRWGLVLNGLANGVKAGDAACAALVERWNRARPAESVTSAELVFVDDITRSEKVLGRAP